MKRVLMCPPTFFTVRDVKNPFMEGAAAVDSDRAALQWQAVRSAFERAGVSVLTIDPVEDLEDMVFAANQTFVGSGTTHARFIVPSRMRHPSREREVEHYVAWFERAGFEVIDIGLDSHAGQFLEGHGDLLAQPGTARVWAGFGIRSSQTGVARFAGAMRGEGIEVCAVALVDPAFYHLDTCFAPLNAEAALIYPDAFAPESLRMLRQRWTRLYEVARVDALNFACNGTVANEWFVAAHATPWLHDVLMREGLRLLAVDTSEFEKAGGSVFCMKAQLD
ncbi:MAG TPA: arginine deiminase-related protein [Candidatus Tumulicola sp.]|jgi:N-dimethylarginine dimethylaminohydrolase